MPDEFVSELPPTVQVGPYHYAFERAIDVDGASRWGETVYVGRLIRFGNLCSEQELPSTLIHELIHAVAKCYEVNMKEEDISRLGHGLAQALQDLGFLPKKLKLAGEQGCNA